MPDKEGEEHQNRMQKFVALKSTEASTTEETDKYSVEKADEESKINCANKLSPHGVCYRYSIFLNNQGSRPISDVEIKVLYPRFLKYFKSYPPEIDIISSTEDYEEKVKTLTIKFNRLDDSKQIFLHFSPYSPTATGEINTIITYVNNDGVPKVIKSNPIEIQIKMVNISPKLIPTSSIRDFTQYPGIKRDMISLGFEKSKKKNLSKFFDVLEKLPQFRNFQLISNDKDKGNLWFFGNEVLSGYDILILIKIRINMIEIINLSKDPIYFIPFFFGVIEKLRDQLDKFYHLECVNCGNILPYLPNKGEKIQCNKCYFEQIFW
ncbi:MAG: hypothetical protein ACFFEN_00120 [Candidatus Thorarchaeota archaeon]